MLIRVFATDTDLWADDTWVMDSTPVECGRSRPTAKRSDLAGFAGYGYCASHSRYCWGLRLHLVCTPEGLPVTFALTDPKIDEREIARDLFEIESELLASRPGQTILADKGYASAEFETFLTGVPQFVGIFGGLVRHLPWSQRCGPLEMPKCVGTRLVD